VTMDGTWLYQYDSVTKQQSVNWRHRGSPLPNYSTMQVQLKDHLNEKTQRKFHQGGPFLARKCPELLGTSTAEETGLAGLPVP
jgi:hypothetical protein